VEGDDLLGDGVNIAARVEALAEPGGICVTDAVMRQLSGKTDFEFEDAGERLLKNISRPVRIHRLVIQHSSPAQAGQSSRASSTLPDRASIAVLPFTNMSSESEQEYFADGIVEDIITALSRFRTLSSPATQRLHKGRAVDVRRRARSRRPLRPEGVCDGPAARSRHGPATKERAERICGRRSSRGDC
jgi:adenylate cyclase